MRFIASLSIVFVATTAFAEGGPVVQLQTCLEQAIGPIELPEDTTEDQRKRIVESIRSEFDNTCMQSATQSCFQSDNSNLCFGGLNRYAEEEYVRIFETIAPQNIDLSNDETVNALIEILKHYRTNELEVGSGYSCNYSKPMCDFLFNSVLLNDLRSTVRNNKQAN